MKFAAPLVALFAVVAAAARWLWSKVRRPDPAAPDTAKPSTGPTEKDRRAALQAAAAEDPTQFERTPFGRRRKKGAAGRAKKARGGPRIAA